MNCPLCDCGAVSPVCETRRGARRLVLVMCDGCGLVRLDPLPSEAELSEYYATEYAAEFGAGDPADARFRANKRKKAEDRAAWLDARGGAAGHVVELGCAEGSFLQLMAERGHSASGLEPDGALAAWASGRLVERGSAPGAVVSGMFPETRPATPAAGAGLVAAFDVVEHARDPVGFVRSAAALAAPGGLVYICVPDFLMPGMNPEHPVIRACHLWYFTRATMTALLARAGLGVVAVEADAVCGKPELKALAQRG